MAGMFVPLPFLFYSAKLGRTTGLKIAAVSFLSIILAMQVMGFTGGIITGAELGLLGLLLAEFFRRDVGIGGMVFGGTLFVVLLGAVILHVLGSLGGGGGVFSMIPEYYARHMERTLSAYQESGAGADAVARLRGSLEWFKGFIERFYPSILVIVSAIVVWVNVLVGRRLLMARGIHVPDLGPLDRWRSPDWLVWVFIGTGFASLLPWGSVNFFALNILVIVGAVYCFHGVSILQFFFNKYRAPKYLRAFAYILMVLQTFLLLGLVVAGLFDQWFDFRKIFKPAKELPSE